MHTIVTDGGPHYLSPLGSWAEDMNAVADDLPFRVATNWIETPTTTRWSMHEHREHELLWGIEGGIMVETPAGITVVPDAVNMWIPAWVPHEVSSPSGSLLSCTWFEPEHCSVEWTQPSLIALSPLLLGVLEHLSDLDLAIDRRRRAELFVFDLLQPSPLVSLTLPMPYSADVRFVAELVIANPADDRGLDELSDLAHVSVRSFTRCFTRETSMSFNQWRVRARIQRAMQLMSAGATITSAGRAVGYHSASSFIAAFTRVVGVTPGSFNNNRR